MQLKTLMRKLQTEVVFVPYFLNWITYIAREVVADTKSISIFVLNIIVCL